MSHETLIIFYVLYEKVICWARLVAQHDTCIYYMVIKINQATDITINIQVSNAEKITRCDNSRQYNVNCDSTGESDN